MNREQVIELMREVGAGHEHPMPNDYAGVVDVFVKFSDLVAAAEREACKSDIEGLHGTVSMFATSRDCTNYNKGVSAALSAIRARNTNKEIK